MTRLERNKRALDRKKEHSTYNFGNHWMPLLVEERRWEFQDGADIVRIVAMAFDSLGISCTKETSQLFRKTINISL